MVVFIRSALFLALAALSACSVKAMQEEGGYSFSKFPSESQLEEVEYYTINGLSPDGLLLHNDTILLIRNAANTAAYHFSTVNLSTRKPAAPLVEAGRKNGQVMSFLSYGLSNNRLWAYDIIKDKIILTNLDSALRLESPKVKEIPLSKFHYSVQVLNDTTLLGSGDYESKYKIHQISLPSGSISKTLGVYAKDAQTALPQAEKMANESFLFVKPSQEKCVLASRYSDRIEIYDLQKPQAKIITGPENYRPDLSVMRGNDGKEISVRNADTRYGFVKGKVTDNFIYLLYSGNNHESKHLHYGKYIYVYDWEGNPVRKLTLSNHVLDFVVTSNDALLYTYDPAAKQIKVAKLGTS